LGRVQRGFEISTKRLYDALKDHSSLNVKLFSGGKVDDAQEIINLPRDFLLNTVLAPITFLNRRRIWEFAYGVEQVSYALFLFSELLKYRPDIVWTKEAPLAHILYYTRPILGLKFKLVFANGGGFKPSTYGIFDHIQQLEETAIADAVAQGVPLSKMTVIPNAVSLRDCPFSKETAKSSFGFASDDWVVLSVAAWNSYHKRIDFLIDEVANMGDGAVHLLLCGHPEPDSKRLKQRAREKLGNRAHWHTLPNEEIPRALRAADAFVLPSVNEHFGTAALEAIIAALPVVLHKNGATKYLSDTSLQTTDLTIPGSITQRLSEFRKQPPLNSDLEQLSMIVRSRFGEKAMTDHFVKMVQSLSVNVDASEKVL
jgi:glycosyltransferase involved in cell wall biosynthesis